MKTLVQEMLDLSRAEQVEIHYKNEVTPIRNVVLHTFHNFKMLYPDFVFNLDDDLNREIYVNIYRNHFERVDKARSRNKGGNGLGLSIAKELLEGYKGDITVESVLGHGSVFRIQLPILKNYVPDEEL